MSIKSLLNIGIKLFKGSSTAKTAAKVGVAAVGTIAAGVGAVAVSNVNFSNFTLENTDSFTASGENGRSREQIYKFIEEICIKYNINPEDAKNAMLLETIAGCTSEELTKKSDAELQEIIRAFDNALPWKIFSWGSKDIDYVKKIAIKANKKYIDSQTGGSVWSNTLRDLKHLIGIDTNVSSVLKDKGFEITPEGMRAYFNQKMAAAITTGDREKIKENYKELMQEFGELLQDSNSPYEKEILTAAISELSSPDRARAAILGVASCANNKEAKQAFARGLSKHFEAITCSTDALGEYTSDDDNTTISHTSYANMSEEDSIIALARMNSRRQELQAKLANGEELTPEEARYYNNAQLSQYAGAVTGASCNSYIEDPSLILSTIDRDTAAFGIQQEVYSRAAAYVENHQNELPITTQQFTETVDRATGNNYTKVLNDIKNGIPESKPETGVNKGVNKEGVNKMNAAADEKSETYNKSRVPAADGQTTVTSPISQSEIGRTTGETTRTAETKTTNKVNEVKSNTRMTHPSNAKTAFLQKKFNEAVSKGVEEVREYQQRYNISEIQLTQDILNSTVATSSLQDWALEKFKRMDTALQRIIFPGIHNDENLKKAALLIDPEELKKMNMTSYYTEKTVENIIEREEKVA